MNETLTGVAALAEKRAEGTMALKQAWQHALQKLLSTGITLEQVELLAAQCSSPQEAMRLSMGLDGGQAGYQCLMAAIDDSVYSLRDWVKALDVLHQWLGRNPRRTNLEHKLGYIHCCSVSEPGRPLSEIVTLMLEEYGYEGMEA